MSCDTKPYALVIEDNPTFAQVLADLLEIKGCRAIVAENALNALKLIAELTPKIIFCSINLPGKVNSFFLANAVKNNSQLSNIPLVAISETINDVEKDRTLQAGFDMLFSKPLKFADFARVLKVFLNI